VTFDSGEDSTAVIIGFTITNGLAPVSGGGIYCDSSGPTIINNIISDNIGTYEGGGICLYNHANPYIAYNIIQNNSSASSGGGIYCYVYSNPTINNNLIVNNYSGSGAGIECNTSFPLIISTTISENSAVFGGGLRGYFSDPQVINCIIYGNSPNEIHDQATITYSDIREGWPGEGNIDQLPLFIDPDNSDFNLCLQSPCIDAGDPSMTDPDSTRADMGMFYYTHPLCELGTIRYVSISGNDTTGDGSIGNPFRTIQYAINISLHTDTVVVLNGEYIENIDFIGKLITVASNFIISADTMDIHNTIINGDSMSTVITFENNEDSLSTLIGFTIKNGYSNFGGGIKCINTDPAIKYNRIINNLSVYDGAGIYCQNAGPIVADNLLNNNVSGRSGGAISCSDSSNAIIFANSIIDNVANWAGGGVHISESNPSISENTLNGNSSIFGGGIGMAGSSPVIFDNSLYDNFTFDGSGYYGSGGGIFVQGYMPEIDSNSIMQNSAVLGGGIFVDAGFPSILNNNINLNTSNGNGGGIYFENCSPQVVENNDIELNTSHNKGGGIYISTSFASISKNIILQNEADFEGGGIFCASSEIVINDNAIQENNALSGGGIYFLGCDSATLIQNRISLNTATENGGGIYLLVSSMLFSNNIIFNNYALGNGGGICTEHSDPSLFNNTVFGNLAEFGGGIYTMITSYPNITNTIFWADSANLGGNEIGGDGASWPTISYCDIQGIVWPGEGNIDINPLFRDPLNYDFHLMSTACGDSADSPCIDAGDPAILDSMLDCSWGMGGLRSDMGAYGGDGDSSNICLYTVGDANNSREFNGLDVTYGVTYFKGGPSPPYECECTPDNYWYVAGDVNGSCSYNGLDITYAVTYFKGGSDPIPCPDCPPAN
jgi:parallel beta-helix repeat protein